MDLPMAHADTRMCVHRHMSADQTYGIRVYLRTLRRMVWQKTPPLELPREPPLELPLEPPLELDPPSGTPAGTLTGTSTGIALGTPIGTLAGIPIGTPTATLT